MEIRKKNFKSKYEKGDSYIISHKGDKAILNTYSGALAHDATGNGHGAYEISQLCKSLFGNYIDDYGFALSSDEDVFELGDSVILDGNWFNPEVVRMHLKKLIKIINGE